MRYMAVMIYLTCCVERLIQIGNDIVNVLDSDAESNHLRRDASPALLFG